ncbi:MAG: peptidyl-prolyl cis-trans isomerase [Balneolaceae bacterium]
MSFKTIFSAFILILAVGCNHTLEKEPVVFAEVGGNELTLSEAKSNIPQHIFDTDSNASYLKYREDWIRRQLILQEAERLNFADREAVQKQLKRLKEEYILQAVQDYIISEYEADVSVSEDEARNYYQQNKDKFTLDERYVQYRHLIARNSQDAQNAKRDLMRGVSWESVANKYSLYADFKIRESERFWPISLAGGDIAQLNRYLNIIGPSEISPTYRSGSEYHFVQLVGERPKGDHPDLDWLITQIEEWLVLEKRKRAFNTYVKNLYLQGQANNEIKIYNVLSQQLPAVTDTASLNNPSNEE